MIIIEIMCDARFDFDVHTTLILLDHEEANELLGCTCSQQGLAN